MSTRHIRKILGKLTLPSPDGISDDTIAPHYQQESFGYAELEVSSSESEEVVEPKEKREPQLEAEPVSDPMPGPSNSKMKSSKKLRRKKKKNNTTKSACSTRSTENLGDIMGCDTGMDSGISYSLPKHLEVSSSESEEVVEPKEKREPQLEAEPVSDPMPGPSNSKMKSSKKLRRIKKRKNTTKSACSTRSTENLDEIDKVLQEVNSMLGILEVTERPPENPVEPAKTLKQLFGISLKYLDPENDYKKLFGPKIGVGIRKKPVRGQYHGELRRAHIIKENHLFNSHYKSNFQHFHRVGLSMSIEKQENGYTYFVFNHSDTYQYKHKLWLATAPYQSETNFLFGVEINLHVEEIMENALVLFMSDHFNEGRTVLEYCIKLMEFVAHPGFNITDMSVRLDYKIDVNRPFFVAVFMYMYVLTIKACHRTALELAKLLMNLDPTDPLALIAVIDVLALRAREYQWLVDTVNHWRELKEIAYLFNITFSYAMATYRVAKKANEPLTNADSLLQDAILRFPQAAKKILEYTNAREWKKIVQHDLFKHGDNPAEMKINSLIKIYAKLVWPIFKEDNALDDFFIRNLNTVLTKYDKDPIVQNFVSSYSERRKYIFQTWPEQITRHYSIIRPFGQTLIDEPFPSTVSVLLSNPVPPRDGYRRYNYPEMSPILID